MSGGGGTTTTQNNQPPQQFLDAYGQVMNQATGVAATPYQNYPGQLQAGFSPMQQQGFDVIGSAPGVQAPYLNAAAQDFSSANAPLAPSMQPYIDQAQQGYQNVQNTNLQSSLTPFQQQAQQGFAAGSQQLTPTQYSGSAVQQYESPYTQSVVNATQNRFNNQNAQQANQLQGNAASAGALGGDRAGVAQAVLAGQQQSAQAPVIAGLENTGFQTAQNEFNTQQQTNLSAQAQSQALQQQAAQGYAGLGSQSLTAAQQQAALQAQAAQGFGQLGQTELGAAQAQGWLGAQTGAGLAGLGNQALAGTISSGNALLGAGAQQQQQAQTGLNIPYQQWQAQLAYPYQSTGWLANIAEGLGGSSGGTGSTTVPGPSVGSQIAGGALGTTGVLGATGAFGSTGWLTGSGASAASDAIGAGSFVNRGGKVVGNGGIGGFANGGSVPDVSMNGINVGQMPGEQMSAPGGFGLPDVSASIVPEVSSHGGGQLINRNYGSTSNSTGPDNTGSDVLTALMIASRIGIGVAALAAANRGGKVRGFDAGGDVPGSEDVLSAGAAVPNARPSIVPQATPSAHGTFGMPKPPQPQKPEDFAGETQTWVNNLKSAIKNPNETHTSARGGSVAVLPHGFAAGGSPAISVTTVPNSKGFGVPTMTVDPSVVGSGGSTASGSPSSQMNAYLAQQAAGAFHPPATPAPAPAPAPAPGGSTGSTTDRPPLTPGQIIAEEGPLSTAAGLFPGNRRGGRIDGFGAGGFIRGFADGGDTTVPAPAFNPAMFAADQFIPPDADAGPTEVDAPPPPGGDDQPDLIPESVRRKAADDAPDAPRAAGLMQEVGPVKPNPKGFHVDPSVLLGDLPPGMAGVARDDEVAEAPAAAPAGRQSTPPPSPRDAHLDAMFADALSKNRALKEDRANPWMALAQAGFGMMAGTSPHAMTNIGQGAVYGLAQYTSSDRAAKELAAKVDESRARLMEAQQYHSDAVDARNYRTGTMSDIATTRNQNALTIAQMRAAQAQARLLDAEGKGKWDTKVDANGDTVLFNATTGEIKPTNFNLGIRPEVKAKLDAQASAQAALQDYRTALISGRLQNASEVQRWHDHLIAKGITDDAIKATDEDIRFLGLHRDLANNLTQTPEQAHSGAGQLRQLNAPGATPPAPTPAAPLPMPESQDALVAGKTYSTRRGPAVWDGTQFMPVQ